MIRNLTVYMVLFILVFGYLGNLAWARINTITLLSAYMAGPVVAGADATSGGQQPEVGSVVGFLAVSQTLDVWAGMQAEVRFNTGGRRYAVAATVRSVTAYGEGPSSSVLLSLSPNSQADMTTMPQPGAPVQVDLRRGSLGTWLGLDQWRAPDQAQQPEPAAVSG